MTDRYIHKSGDGYVISDSPISPHAHTGPSDDEGLFVHFFWTGLLAAGGAIGIGWWQGSMRAALLGACLGLAIVAVGSLIGSYRIKSRGDSGFGWPLSGAIINIVLILGILALS